MKTFKEFLQEQAASVRADEAAREAKKDHWVASVDALIARMKSWLEESDPEGLLKLETRLVERTEESIGTYEIRALYIRLGSRVVAVEPVACDILGPVYKPRAGTWLGRVDLSGDPYTSKIYKFSAQDDVEQWYILDESDYQLRPFTRETFDSALMGLFA